MVTFPDPFIQDIELKSNAGAFCGPDAEGVGVWAGGGFPAGPITLV